MTSVMAVEVHLTLRPASIYQCPWQQRGKGATIKGLNSAEGYIRRQLARNLN
ncbi:MAG: ribosome-binding factor A [Blautia obeum]